MHVKKIKKPIGKTGYPVSGNLRISGRISESGFSKPGYPGIWYPGSKSVSGTTLIDTITVWEFFIYLDIKINHNLMLPSVIILS